MGVTAYFLVSVNYRQSKDDIAFLEREDSINDMVEFNSVLNSCRPLVTFQLYLEQKYPDFVALLNFVKFYEQQIQYNKEKQDLEDEVDNLNIQISDFHSNENQKEEKRAVQERAQKISEMTSIEFEIYALLGQMTDLYNYSKMSFQRCFAEHDYSIIKNKDAFEIFV